MIVVAKILLAATRTWNGNPRFNEQEKGTLTEDSPFANLQRLSAAQFEKGYINELIEEVPQLWDAARQFRLWALKHYKRLGEGSSRVVVSIDKDHALKIATNAAGIAQNKVESHIAQKIHDLPITQVHYISPEGLYLVVDLAHTLNESHFYSKFGIKFEDFCELLRNEQGLSDSELDDAIYGLPPRAGTLIESIRDHGLVLSDVGSKEQWGEVKKNPVLLDYGFTGEVQQEHYRK